MRRVLHRVFRIVLVVFISLIFTGISQAEYRFDFDIFTQNGPYYDDPRLQFSVVVSNGQNHVDFTFYNNSSINSSLARVYFDDGSLLGISGITNGPDTLFVEGIPGQQNLPGGESIGFYADREFTIGADPPPSSNGVNAPPAGYEWVKVGFDLINGGTIEGVIQELITGELRIGLHIISIDGPPTSSESAIMIVPEPATLLLLATGAAVALRKRKR